MLVALANGAVYAVPYVPTPEGIFLKRPSRADASRLITCRVKLMKKAPEIGRYLDAEEKAFIQALEAGDAPLKERTYGRAQTGDRGDGARGDD